MLDYDSKKIASPSNGSILISISGWCIALFPVVFQLVFHMSGTAIRLPEWAGWGIYFAPSAVAAAGTGLGIIGFIISPLPRDRTGIVYASINGFLCLAYLTASIALLVLLNSIH